ncbi:MAG: tetratricopeptide repeat protein [Candidatus Omnitrophica bacterium]|nr:tetratricopeptide repeat protein [Candidatus Omnitrophota bacterium]
MTKFKHILSCILLVLISFVVFSNTLDNAFIWDDKSLIVENKYIQSLKSIPFLFSLQYWKDYAPDSRGAYRPVREVTLVLDYFFWRLNPRGYHLTNLILHSANVIFVYLVALALLSLAGNVQRKEEAGRFNWSWFLAIPFMSAALFATHPIHTESVTWIKNRSDLLTLGFFLLAFLFFMRFSLSRNAVEYGVSIFCYILALFSKEAALMIPFIFMLYGFLFLRRSKRPRFVFSVIPFFIVGGLFFIFERALASGGTLPAEGAPINSYSHILAVVKTIGYYTKLLILPTHLSVDRLFNIPQSIREPGVTSSIFLIGIVMLLMLRLFRASRLAVFSLFWIFLTILPVSNIIFFQGRPIAEQRLYIPSFGFCFLLAASLQKLSLTSGNRPPLQRILRKIVIISFIALLTLYSYTTVRRNLDWKDPITFWQTAIKNSPGSYRVRYNLGNEYFHNGKFEKARVSYQDAIALKPDYFLAYFNLGIVNQFTGKTEDALSALNKASIISPSAEVQLNLGAVYKQRGELDKAFECFRKAIEINPNFAIAYDRLGTIYYISGDKENALRFYKEAIGRNPYYAEAYNNLGVVLLELGRPKEAAAAYKRSIALNPAYARAYYNLGLVYLRDGRTKEGVDALKKAAEFDFKDTRMHVHMGLIFKKLKDIPAAIASFNKALAINPLQEEAYFNLGELYADAGNYPQAIDMYQKAIMLNPKVSAVYNNLAAVYRAMGKQEEAIGLYRIAIEMEPDSPSAYNNLALVYFQQKQYELAVEYYEKAKQRGVDNPGLCEALAPFRK